jgi:hypothetical protein
LVSTRVTWLNGRSSAPRWRASRRWPTSGDAIAPMAQPAWHQPQLVQAGRPLYSVLLIDVGIGASGMPCALNASLKIVPFRNAFSGGIG